MRPEIEQRIRNFSDEFLKKQYFEAQQDYTPEAIAIMKDEIARRQLDAKVEKDDDHNLTGNESSELNPEDFKVLESKFDQNGVMIVREIMQEEKIRGFIQSSEDSEDATSSDGAPSYYNIYIHKDRYEQAGQLISNYFNSENGIYIRKFADTQERVKSFSFYELSLTGPELEEEIDVHFSPEELRDISLYIERFISEVDEIEQSGKIIFYYDNLEHCRKHTQESKTSSFTRADLLTILETIQVYIDDPGLPASLLQVAESLMGFISE